MMAALIALPCILAMMIIVDLILGIVLKVFSIIDHDNKTDSTRMRAGR